MEIGGGVRAIDTTMRNQKAGERRDSKTLVHGTHLSAVSAHRLGQPALSKGRARSSGERPSPSSRNGIAGSSGADGEASDDEDEEEEEEEEATDRAAATCKSRMSDALLAVRRN